MKWHRKHGTKLLAKVKETHNLDKARVGTGGEIIMPPSRLAVLNWGNFAP